jgi:carbonic anhydrase/acetyltransferase-like protein (isoleucine patch superfamily)
MKGNSKKEKYELTGEIKELDDGTILERIRALYDFGDVKAGDLGGWIERKSNLSHLDGLAWVSDEAIVKGYAEVKNHALVSGNAVVEDHAIVEDWATVCGDSVVRDNAIVKDFATVGGNAFVSGNSTVSDWAKITDNAIVKDNAIIHDYANIGGDAFIGGNAVVKDWASVRDSTVVDIAKVCDYAVVEGKARVDGHMVLNNHMRLNGEERLYKIIEGHEPFFKSQRLVRDFTKDSQEFSNRTDYDYYYVDRKFYIKTTECGTREVSVREISKEYLRFEIDDEILNHITEDGPVNEEAPATYVKAERSSEATEEKFERTFDQINEEIEKQEPFSETTYSVSKMIEERVEERMDVINSYHKIEGRFYEKRVEQITRTEFELDGEVYKIITLPADSSIRKIEKTVAEFIAFGHDPAEIGCNSRRGPSDETFIEIFGESRTEYSERRKIPLITLEEAISATYVKAERPTKSIEQESDSEIEM